MNLQRVMPSRHITWLMLREVALKSVKIYTVISDDTINLGDKFFFLTPGVASNFLRPLLMKVGALVSGGKGSCFPMMCCIDYGHEIVTLANLILLDDSVDELDSYVSDSMCGTMTPLMKISSEIQ